MLGRFCLMRVLGLAAVLGLAGSAIGATTVVQPDEAASQDTYVYNYTNGNFANYVELGVANAFVPFPSPGSSHTVQTLIRFDLPSILSADVTDAQLMLYSITPTFAPTPPSPATPITVDVYAVTSAWSEGTATFSTAPSHAAVAETQVSVDAINSWVSIDLTNLVKSWLDTPASNLGVTLITPQTTLVAAQFHSANFAGDGSLRPKLVINSVPEPASLALLALAGLMPRRSRRR